jgi:hypothetical protein
VSDFVDYRPVCGGRTNLAQNTPPIGAGAFLTTYVRNATLSCRYKYHINKEFMKNYKMMIFVLFLASNLLAGCAYNPFSRGPYYDSDIHAAQRLRTTDIVVQRERFGLLADIVERPFAGDNGLYFKATWVVPGAILEYSQTVGMSSRVEYDHDEKLLFQYDDYPDAQKIVAHGTVKGDGSIYWKSFKQESYDMVLTAAGVYFDAPSRKVLYIENSKKFADQVASSEAMLAMAQQQNAEVEAEIRAYKQQGREAYMGKILQSTRDDLALRNGSSSSSPALSGRSSINEDSATPNRQQTSATASVPKAKDKADKMKPIASSSALASNQIKSVGTTVAADALLATPEAVIVCTIPAGPDAAFKCENPINSSSGSAKSISGYRTPAEMVRKSDSSCPDQRALQSATHLVWGCGFAATGFMNAKDRGAGIDIQGRRTYYCTPMQSSCRRQAR